MGVAVAVAVAATEGTTVAVSLTGSVGRADGVAVGVISSMTTSPESDEPPPHAAASIANTTTPARAPRDDQPAAILETWCMRRS